MQALQDFWPVFALFGFLAALMFLRILALNLQQALQRHDIIREAVRLRRAYEEDLRRRQGIEVGDDGVFEV